MRDKQGRGIIRRQPVTSTTIGATGLAATIIWTFQLEGRSAALVTGGIAVAAWVVNRVSSGLDDNGGLMGLWNRLLHGRQSGV